jgi:diguanylate cyclase (GGDEF)-like protein
MVQLELFDLIQASVTAILYTEIRRSHRREFVGSWAAGEGFRTAAIALSLATAAWSPEASRMILGAGAGLAGLFLLNGSWQLAYLTPLPLPARRSLRFALPVAGAASALFWAGAPLVVLGSARLLSSSAFGTRALRTRATSAPALIAMVLAAGLEIAIGLGIGGATLAPFRIAAVWTAALLLVSAAIDDEREAAQNAAAQAEYLAYHDPLTGLANRALFCDTLIAAVAHSERRGYGIAVLFIDLDRFKQVNDLAGHAAGDRVLKVMAERMAGCLRREDLIARIAGDEFVALVRDAGDEDAALSVGMKLLDVLHQPVEVAHHTFVLDASIGVALFPRDGDSQEALLLAADRAMYRAKAAGGRQVTFADPAPHSQIHLAPPHGTANRAAAAQT